VVEPTVLATVHVLREAARIGVSRAILTSSTAALGTDATGRDPLNEGDWNHDAENAYHRAKTLAEKRAWEIAKTDNLDLVVVNPASFLGPNFFRHTPTTRVLADLVAGRAPVIPPFDLSWVDVRDVAWAHVLAAENAKAHGRYVVSTVHLSFAELVERFLLIDPHVAVPTRLTPAVLAPLTPAFEWARSKFFGVPRSISTSLAKDLAGKALRVSSARAERELSWSPIDLDVSLRDTLLWLREQYES
jgi:dihydroflavonol-4-reductase